MKKIYFFRENSTALKRLLRRKAKHHSCIYLRYGIHKSTIFEKISSRSQQIAISGLQPGAEYEIAVKVVMSDGLESAWSIRELINTPTEGIHFLTVWTNFVKNLKKYQRIFQILLCDHFSLTLLVTSSSACVVLRAH